MEGKKWFVTSFIDKDHHFSVMSSPMFISHINFTEYPMIDLKPDEKKRYKSNKNNLLI